MATEVRTIDACHRPYRLTAAQFEGMIEAGLLEENDDLELLGGILYKMVKKEDHNFSVGQTAESLRRILPDDFHVREEKSLRHGKKSLPEPDVAVVLGRSSDYRPQPPSTRDVSLIVEVCHHTRKADYEQKYPRYAAARISVYWIVDLQLRRVEVFTRPTGRGATAGYAEHTTFLEDSEVPVLLKGHQIGQIAVAVLLPPRV
jgi:Uma2 family endonuclease